MRFFLSLSVSIPKGEGSIAKRWNASLDVLKTVLRRFIKFQRAILIARLGRNNTTHDFSRGTRDGNEQKNKKMSVPFPDIIDLFQE